MSVDVQSRRNPRQFLPVAVVTATVESIALAARETAGVMIALDSGTIVDGTHTPKLQDSPDAVIWTDVPPFELQGAFSVIQADDIQKVGYRGRQPFIRLVVTVAGATLGGVYGAYLDRAKPGIIGDYDLSTINVLQGPESLLLPVPPGPGPDPNFGLARDWDGATRNRIVTTPTGVTNGRVGTFSCWFKMANITSPIQMTTLMWSESPGPGFAQGGLIRHAVLTQGMKVILNINTTAGQTGLTMNNHSGLLLNTWHHFMASWENTFPLDAANNLTVYFDGVQSLDGVGGANLSQANSDFDLAYATKGKSYTQGSRAPNFDNPGFELFLDACLSNFYFNTDERLDLTILANREKFRTGAPGQATGVQVDLGDDGSLPTGSQPAWYAANGELNTNNGYADDLPVITGAVTDCADAPPTS